MTNLGLRDDTEQEEWETKMGSLADPTPANAKNKGATERKRDRGADNGTGDDLRDTTSAQEEAQAEGGTGGEATSECSKLDETEDAVAEAVREMETETKEQANEEEGAGRQRTIDTERENEGIRDAAGQTCRQRQQPQGREQRRDEETIEASTTRPGAKSMRNTTNPMDRLTPLQRVQQRLREKFGNDILWTHEKDAMREGRLGEEDIGTSSLQGGDLRAATKRRETPEDRYRKMGKAPMEYGTPENTTPSGRGRNPTTPPTTRYVGTPEQRI